MHTISTGVCLVFLYLCFVVTDPISAFAEGDLSAGHPNSEVGAADKIHTESGLDPYLDTDGDGVINSLEYTFNADPTDFDSKPVGIYYEYDSFGRIKEIRRFTTP